MTPEEKELLKRAVAIGEENNDILRSMQRSQRLASIARWIYWIFIIGSAVGAYYLIQPYIDAITGAAGGTKSSWSDIFSSFNQ